MAATFTLTLVDKVSGAAKSAQGGLKDVTGSLKDVAPQSSSATQGLQQVTGGLDDVGEGSLEGGGALGQFGEQLAALGPEGIAVAAIVAVVVAAVAALVVVLYEGAKAAIAVTQQRDALVQTFAALGKGAGAGEKTLAAVEKLASALPFTTAQVGAWAKSLMGAGIQGAAMETAVKAIAAATAIMGESGGAAAETLIKRFAEMEATAGKVKLDRRLLAQMAAAGVSADALASALGVPVAKLATMSLSAKQVGDAMQKALITKGAGALEAMGATWTSISAKLSEGFSSIFEGLGPAVQPFMAEVKALFGEFFKGSTTMSGFKSIVTAVLTQVFALGTKVVHALHVGFLFVQVAALKVAIAIAPIVLWLKAIVTSSAFLTVLKYVLIAIAVVLGVIALVLGVVVAAGLLGLFLLVLPFLLIGAAVVALVAGLIWLGGQIVDFASSAIDALSGWASGAVDAAGNFISGIVDGIANGAGMVIDAIKNLASGALGAFKSILGISSPSKVMMRMGLYTTAGFAGGLDAGAGDVASSAAGVGASAIGGVAAGAGGPGGASSTGGAGGLTIGDITITITGASGGALELTEEAVSLIFERLAMSQGLIAGAST